MESYCSLAILQIHIEFWHSLVTGAFYLSVFRKILRPTCGFNNQRTLYYQVKFLSGLALANFHGFIIFSQGLRSRHIVKKHIKKLGKPRMRNIAEPHETSANIA